MAWFGASIFLSAFLLFGLQPLVGKALLPWFGGVPAVWTTCLLFFQLCVLGGTAWAHALQRAAPRRQVQAHAGLLLVALATLAAAAAFGRAPLLLDARWKPAGADWPTLRALVVLGASALVPTVALSATSPLLQGWLVGARPGASPFRLYAVSNAGSLLALLSYPVLVVPLLPLVTQGWAFGAGFAALVVALGLCARAAWRQPAAAASSEAAQPAAPRTRLAWLGLAALPSLLLLGITNHLCQEVAPVPLLWVLPLSVYLLTFILCFDGARWYTRRRFLAPLGVGLLLAPASSLARAPVVLQVVLFCALLFACGMVCHGELAAKKPQAAGLTLFYLHVGAGGALGGVFVALGAPWLFDSYFELQLGLLAAGALVVGLARSGPRAPRPAVRLGANALLFALGALVVAATFGAPAHHQQASRSFYGVLRVVRDALGPDGAPRVGLLHGATLHGFQVDTEAHRGRATAYYPPASGVGRALLGHPRRARGQPLTVGVIGLGVGTLAAYAAPGDAVRFYELSPEVARLAADPMTFTYLSQAKGEVETVLGDARLSLERELSGSGPRRFDVLVLDAFGSDSVPVHLLTTEAFALYRAHLRDAESLVAVHATNRTLDLPAVVFSLARATGLQAVHVRRRPAATAAEQLELPSDWVLLATNTQALPPGTEDRVPAPPPCPGPSPTTRRTCWACCGSQNQDRG